MSDATSQAPWLADVTMTNDARSVLRRAGSLAAGRGVAPDQCDSIDVLAALLQTRGTLADRTIRTLGVDPSLVVRLIPARDGTLGLPAKQVLLNSYREAQVLGHYQVDSIHLLLAMLYSDSPATSSVLQGAGVTLYDLRRHLQTEAPPTPDPQRARSERRQRKPPDGSLRRRPLASLRHAVRLSPVFLGLVAFTAVAGAELWFDVVPDAVGVFMILFVVGGWIISLCIHEFGHAAVAYVSGDVSVESHGYLSLNPIRYVNPFMSIVLPVAFLLLGGIGLPGGAVYINHSAIRSRGWDSAVSIAGPAGTLVCALLIAAVFTLPGHEAWITPDRFWFFAGLSLLGFVQVSALVLNLIPVPGLDGFGIIAPWLPDSARFAAYRFATFAMIGLFVALWYVPFVRGAYFSTIFSLSALGNIDQNFVYLALTQMHHL